MADQYRYVLYGLLAIDIGLTGDPTLEPVHLGHGVMASSQCIQCWKGFLMVQGEFLATIHLGCSGVISEAVGAAEHIPTIVRHLPRLGVCLLKDQTSNTRLHVSDDPPEPRSERGSGPEGDLSSCPGRVSFVEISVLPFMQI